MRVDLNIALELIRAADIFNIGDIEIIQDLQVLFKERGCNRSKLISYRMRNEYYKSVVYVLIERSRRRRLVSNSWAGMIAFLSNLEVTTFLGLGQTP